MWLFVNNQHCFGYIQITTLNNKNTFGAPYLSTHAPLRFNSSMSSLLGAFDSLSPPRLAFLAWGDFQARSRFARLTIPEDKWGTTRSLLKCCDGVPPVNRPLVEQGTRKREKRKLIDR